MDQIWTTEGSRPGSRLSAENAHAGDIAYLLGLGRLRDRVGFPLPRRPSAPTPSFAT